MTSSMLNEIKVELRSLLISSKHGLTDDELSADYALFNNQRSIPYEKFGYSTINEFFNSLNDILYRTTDGYIHPIVDSSTEHIYKFVQQQRNKKKTKQLSKDHQKHKPLTIRNRPKKSIPIKHIHSTVGANMAAEKRKLTRNESSIITFERVIVTNEFLKSLLCHFQQQQK